MKSKRNKPNFSIYMPDDVRDSIKDFIAEDKFTSIAAFLIASARINIDCIKSMKP